MSKAALDQFTKTTALELTSQQVRCNSVNPGVIKTEIHTRAGMSEEEYSKVRHLFDWQEILQILEFSVVGSSKFWQRKNIPW